MTGHGLRQHGDALACAGGLRAAAGCEPVNGAPQSCRAAEPCATFRSHEILASSRVLRTGADDARRDSRTGARPERSAHPQPRGGAELLRHSADSRASIRSGRPFRSLPARKSPALWMRWAPEVKHVFPGDPVTAMTHNGAFAEYSLAAGSRTFHMIAGMDFPEAAAMPVVYHTSYFALHRRAALAHREWLLVHAGASGVGMSAIQIGKAYGAQVIATAGSAGEAGLLPGAGRGSRLAVHRPGMGRAGQGNYRRARRGRGVRSGGRRRVRPVDALHRGGRTHAGDRLRQRAHSQRAGQPHPAEGYLDCGRALGAVRRSSTRNSSRTRTRC